MGKAIILMYHRIAEPVPDPWGLCVSPQRFADQLDVIRDSAVRLAALPQALEDGNHLSPAIAVTFDDGYADNLHNAAPLLERYGVPATVFVAAGYAGSGREFWWDVPERIFLRPGKLPQLLQLQAGGVSGTWDLGESAEFNEAEMRKFAGWRPWQDAPSKRHSTYYSVWQLLQPLQDDDRLEALQALEAWAGNGNHGDSLQRPVTSEELSRLGASRFVDIGAQTRMHPLLSALPVAQQREEIEGSKADLEQRLNRTINTFAYPYGAKSCYTEDTKAIVREAGFALACSTTAAVAVPESDIFALPRFQVENWDRNEFQQRLSEWLEKV